MDLRRITPARAAVAYAAFGVAWIVASDALVAALYPGSATVAQNLKGIAFVAVSAGLIYLIVLASRRSLAEANAELERANRQAVLLRRILRHNVRNTVNGSGATPRSSARGPRTRTWRPTPGRLSGPPTS